LQENKACGFRDDDNRCRIHARLGMGVKPLVCRLYPYTLAETPAGVFAGLRFSCPAAVAGEGTSLEESRDELERLAREIFPPPRPALPDGVRFTSRQTISWDDLLSVEGVLLGLLEDNRRPLAHAVRACCGFLQLLADSRFYALEPARRREFLSLVGDHALAEPVPDAPVPVLRWVERFNLRQAASICYNYEYLVPPAGLAPRLAYHAAHMRDALAFLFGRGTIRPREIEPGVPLDAVSEVACGLDDPGRAALVRRCMVLKLAGKSTFGSLLFGMRYLDGFYLMLSAAAAGLWYARVFARWAGRDEASTDDVIRGLQYMDYAFGGSPAVKALTHRSKIFSLTRPRVALNLFLHMAAERVDPPAASPVP
jgi:hypothetical protein